MHTTNYINTFIAVAEDCPISKAEIPPVKEGKTTVANIQFDMLYDHPYEYTSDDVIFQVYASKNDVKGKTALQAEREKFFSKGQPCLRSSPLTKRYGWGVHNDANGKIAIYPMESREYRELKSDKNLKVVRAMRTSK